MKIVQLATEFAPLAKAGGLGEVVIGLSKELLRQGHTVEVILPKYDCIDMKSLEQVRLSIPDFKCSEKGASHANALWQGFFQKVPLSLVEARHASGYFHRGKIYGCDDDIARFLYFSKAAIEILSLRREVIDVLHLHDWPVAIAAVLARDFYNLPIRSIVLTVHNAAYQGLCASWDLDAIGLNGLKYLVPEKLQDNSPDKPSLINLLKGGVVYADAVVAVSPQYAKEMVTPEAGYGLQKTFLKYRKKIFGFLNGLDQDLWNPEKDSFLVAPYGSKDSYKQVCEAKELMRAFLRDKCTLSSSGRPWVGAVTRLAIQKGPELIEEAFYETLQMGGTFLLLGSPSSPDIEQHFRALQEKEKNNPHLFLCLEYNEALAHQIYASLDFLIIPSLYEPCGLSQMIAMRYGTIPIARATGGHKDTIFPSNGFLFSDFTKKSVRRGLQTAFSLFQRDPSSIEILVKNAMQIDWSWKKPTEQYVEIYNKSLTLELKSP